MKRCPVTHFGTPPPSTTVACIPCAWTGDDVAFFTGPNFPARVMYFPGGAPLSLSSISWMTFIKSGFESSSECLAIAILPRALYLWRGFTLSRWADEGKAMHVNVSAGSVFVRSAILCMRYCTSHVFPFQRLETIPLVRSLWSRSIVFLAIPCICFVLCHLILHLDVA